MTVSDAELAFYLQVLNDPNKSKYSIQDLRYAYFLAGLSGALPGSALAYSGVTVGAALYHLAGGTGGGSGQFGRGLNSLTAVPFPVDQNCTIDRIGVRVAGAGAASSVVRLGLYADDGHGQPGALIADFGTISTAASGYVELTISQALTANTMYWLAAVTQGASNNGMNVQTSMPNLPRLRASSAMGAANIAGFSYGGPIKANVSGALPNPFAQDTNDLCPIGGVPTILVRIT